MMVAAISETCMSENPGPGLIGSDYPQESVSPIPFKGTPFGKCCTGEIGGSGLSHVRFCFPAVVDFSLTCGMDYTDKRLSNAGNEPT